jgi:hypothetical protein
MSFTPRITTPEINSVQYYAQLNNYNDYNDKLEEGTQDKQNIQVILKSNTIIPLTKQEERLKYAFLGLSIYFLSISCISILLNITLFNEKEEILSSLISSIFGVSTFFSGVSFGCSISI